MITYKPIIIPNNKRRDGTYPVKVRVYLNGKVRRLPTNLVCEQKDLTRSLRIKNPDILKKADELIKRMRAITDHYSVDELESRSIDWLVIRIQEGLKGEHFSLDFFEWGEAYIQSKTPSTRWAYARALNAFERFLGVRSIDINDITKMMLLDFAEFVEKEPKMHYDIASGRTIPTGKKKVANASSAVHMMKLQHIFNAAKDRYNDEDMDIVRISRSPFKTLKKVVPSGGMGQKALDRSIVQKLINAVVEDEWERVAIDAFLVSFSLMGANLADLYSAMPFDGNVWKYNRQKTSKRRQDGAEIRVEIPEQIHPHLERLKTGSGWWLPELHRAGATKVACNAKLNYALRKWQKREGVEDFTFYSARHSFATIARELGYDLASINECLCHKDNLEMGRIYASLTWEQKNAINRAVVDSFEW